MENITDTILENRPEIIVVDLPYAVPHDIEYLFQVQDNINKVVALGEHDDKLAVYSRELIQPATVSNLINMLVKGGD